MNKKKRYILDRFLRSSILFYLLPLEVSDQDFVSADTQNEMTLTREQKKPDRVIPTFPREGDAFSNLWQLQGLNDEEVDES